ncbi:DUF502 domain-containing protein [candidate division KSB1 bacterium]|nr:DUF502 domain-containing protein [candidate division KSB1 bacterium]
MVPQGHSPAIGKRIRGYFFAGLLVLIPLVLTVYVVWQLFINLDGLLNQYVSRGIYRAIGIQSQDHYIPGLGLLAMIILIFVVGFVARNYFGRKLLFLSDLLLSRIPVVRHIYGTFQQISQAFLSDHSEVFKQAVLFEYPRKGIYSIGFMTQDTKGVVQESLDQDMVSIFLPTTPNPTSGYLLFVPKKDIQLLNISVEEALKLVISGGAIVPLKSKIVAVNELNKKTSSDQS